MTTTTLTAIAALTTCGGLSPQLAGAVQAGLSRGAPDVERLYELGKRHQWNSAELPWGELKLGELPSFLREGIADALAQTHYGELGALTASARLVQTSPHLADRLFGATQVVDEARHVEWFTRLLHELDAPTKVMPELAAFVDGVVNTADPLALLVGMNILIEGLAQTLLCEAGRVLSSFDAPELSSLRQVGTWLSDRIGRDESRHLAFGIQRVREEVTALDLTRRRALHTQVAQWSEQLVELTRARCTGMSMLGLDGDLLLERCISDNRVRLAHVGLGGDA